MFPAAFDYRSPETLDEVLGILTEHGDEAKVMAGGQSLIPLLKLRFAKPTLVVDIGRVPGMASVRSDGGSIRIGARTRHVIFERDGEIRRLCPILAATAPQISDPLVRNLGTVGGSVCHADPSGDWGSVMLALGADFLVRSRKGERTIAAADFFDGPFTTALAGDEILTEIRVPASSGGPNAAGTYLKLERKVGDFATVGVAVQVEMSNGTIGRAGIGLTSVSAKNLKATAAEEHLAGKEPTDAVIAEAARLASEIAEPRDDIRGSAAYKKDMVRLFVLRGLRQSIARIREMRG